MSALTRQNIEQGCGLEFLYLYYKNRAIKQIQMQYKSLSPDTPMLIDVILERIVYDHRDLHLVINRIFNDFDYKNCFKIRDKMFQRFSDKISVTTTLDSLSDCQFFGFSVWISQSISVEKLGADDDHDTPCPCRQTSTEPVIMSNDGTTCETVDTERS